MAQPQPAEQPIDTARFIIEDVRRRVPLPPSITPEDAIQAVMCAFSQHVSRGEAVHVFDALPQVVQPLLERCMIHRDEEARRFGRDELVLAVADHLHVQLEQADEITSAVLHAISSRLPEREVTAVAAQLPAELRHLWVVSRVPVGAPVAPHPILTRIEQSVSLHRGITGVGAFTSVVGQLTHRLSLGEAHQLVSALPSDLRQLLDEHLLGRGEHPEKLGKTTYLERVAKDLKIDDLDEAERVAKAVFKHIEDHIPGSVFAHVEAQLPRELSDLWTLPY